MNDKEMEAHDALKFLYSLSLNCSIGDIQEKQVKVAFEAVHASLTELAEIKKRAEEQRKKYEGGSDWYGSRDPVIAVIDYILKGETK